MLAASNNGRREILGLTLVLGVVGSVGIQAQGLNRNPEPRVPFGGFLNPVTVMGEVNRPGEYHVIPNLTLAQFVDAAGGLTPNADGVVVLVHFSTNPPVSSPSRAQIAALIRPGAPVPSGVSLRRISISDRATLATAMRIEPQDVIYIPSRTEV
jgi:hypothetical protein